MSNASIDCLTCPITCSTFEDPVIAEDGHTYEREAIIKWIQSGGTSPITRMTLTIDGLRPNYIVQKLVQDFRHAISKRQCKFKIGVDVERNDVPFFETTGKSISNAQWLGYLNGPPIVLLKLFGARAEKEASYYEDPTRHPYIVYTYGLVEPAQQYANYVLLLQEKAPGGNLSHFLEHRAEKQLTKPLGNLLLNHIFLQIVEAMIFLAEKKIFHGDLACRNVLVFQIDENQPQRTLVKLTDFGISRGNTMYSKIDAVQTVMDVIPTRTTASEILQDNPITEKSDMYAMGVLMWEAFSNGNLPWGEISKESIVREKVIRGERLSRPVNCQSDRQWELLLKCMSHQAEDRPTFRELKEQLKQFLVPEIQISSIPKISPNEPSQKVKPIEMKHLLDRTDSESHSSTPRASPTPGIKDRLDL